MRMPMVDVPFRTLVINPLGDAFFSNLLHYVRSGDFVQALLRDTHSPDELAFALGALSHYLGGSLGHSLATNISVPVEWPKLGKEHGPWVTYDEDPHAHVQTEFAFDVSQISKHCFAPPDYVESIGLKVPLLLLSRAFEEPYGIPLNDILGGSQHPNLLGYQTWYVTYCHAWQRQRRYSMRRTCLQTHPALS